MPVRLNTNENPHPPSAALVDDAAESAVPRPPNCTAIPIATPSTCGAITADLSDLATGVQGQRRERLGGKRIQRNPAALLQAFGGPGRSAIGFVPSIPMHPIIADGTQTRWIAAAG